MVTQYRVHLQTLILLFFVVHLSRPVCVDVSSDTEAVLGESMKLTCISCMKREEVKAKTTVNWYFMQTAEESIPPEKIHIYERIQDEEKPKALFRGRLEWLGSKDSQDASLKIHKVTYNDSGIYECHIYRELDFGSFTHPTLDIKNITVKVKETATVDATAIYSEIMMYVLLVFLTFWLLVEMVYCYRKISKSDEQAQDTAY